ncbi:28S ribosomal protein S29, mitochondrial [Amphibalanus amphitrite]|uniref:Small ribosomal subunit protein mS29 n=1 Tax=Amphibalanus amphitrite TaxID=1232801 RepID=A0A6A4W0X8_AMPAM|nr:28S ribosomal protein S29, mitochondrial [Amphibalanus amphitrite]
MLPRCRLTRLCWLGLRPMSAAAAPEPAPSVFRTSVSDPREHSRSDLGRLYTVDREDHRRLFQVTGLRKSLSAQARTFCELALMVRQPALNVLDSLRASDPSRPSLRFLLYGPYGGGKSTTVAHVLHWAAASGWLLVHFPEADRWGLRFREVTASASDPQAVDHPVDAALWLAHFRAQNAARLAELDLRTGETYTWSRREATEAGSPLTDLVELGVTRGKHASQCVLALLAELKAHASAGRCRLLMAVEKVNAFWCDSTARREDGSTVKFGDMTVIRAAEQLLRPDWSGGAVLTTIAPVRGGPEGSHLPRHQLGADGWRALEPFVPIRVDDMSRAETYTMIDYFLERRWLQAPAAATERGKQELFFRSGGNPGKLAEICSMY